VLFVTLPKNEAAKPRRIRVNDVVNGPQWQKERAPSCQIRGDAGVCYTPVSDILGE